MAFKDSRGYDHENQNEADRANTQIEFADKFQQEHPGSSNEDLQEYMQSPDIQGQIEAKHNEGKTPQEIAQENEQHAKDNPEGFSHDGTPINQNAQYHDPGGAYVGGSKGAGAEIKQSFLDGEKLNDGLQASNLGAMQGSIANMKADRAPIEQNGALLSREADARVQQGQSLDLQRDAAMGNAPSAAAAQTTMGMNDAMGGQAGASGAARGLSALSGVQGTGAQGMGMQGSSLALQGGMGRSQEMGQNIGMYGSSAGDMRSGDLGRLDASSKFAIAGQGINDDWKIGNANLAGKQGQLGAALGTADDAWFGASQEPDKRQMAMNQEMKAVQAGANTDAAQAARAAANAANDKNRAIAGGAVTAGLTAAGTAVGGPAGGAAGGMGGSYLNNLYDEEEKKKRGH